MSDPVDKTCPKMETSDANLTYYRIKNWNEYFENNRTREMKHMAWVPVPNKHDGEGYQRIMQQKDGILIYGCWHLILQVASKCLRERGTLLRDDGTPLTAAAIALKTGWRHPRNFERALEFLCTREVAWIERVTTNGQIIPHPPAEIPQPPARNRTEQNRIEENGKDPQMCEFIRFWEAYPRKSGKKIALTAWKNAKDKPELSAILAAIESQKQSDQWQKENGRFIPMPATWLNQGRWDDKLPAYQPKGEYGRQIERRALKESGEYPENIRPRIIKGSDPI